MTRISAWKADRVLTVSSNSKKDIKDYCNISDEKITVTYIGINKAILNPNKNEWEKFKNEKKIPGGYILYVGTLEPGKNLVTLIRAFKILKEKNQISQKLVIAGGKGWLFESIFDEVKNLKLEEYVIFTDYVPYDVLGLLYKNATVFILPSLYEGFGVPPLEAMYFGIPVVASKTSSLPEVVGDAGKFFDPNNVIEIADTIFEVLTNLDLRETMIAKGYEQATRFSWTRTAILTLNEFLKLNEYGCKNCNRNIKF